MAVRTAIFDFDGTVANTVEQAVGVLHELSRELGFRDADAEEIKVLRGLPPREIAQRLELAWHKVPRLVARARSEIALRMDRVKPCAGVPEAIEQLRAEGLSIGLLTSNNRRNVDLFLAHNAIAFDFITTGSGLWSKDRRLAAVLRKRAIAKDATAYIGDEVRDIEAAKQVGVRSVAVGWGYSTPELLAQHAPDHLVLDARELVRALAPHDAPSA